MVEEPSVEAGGAGVLPAAAAEAPSEAELVVARGRFAELRRRCGFDEKAPPLDPAGLLEAVAVLESLAVAWEGSGAARGGGRGRR